MHDHREILALAAAAIDFDLDPTERAQLDAALEACSLCRRQASAMRATATVLRRPLDIGTPSQVRDVVIGAAVRDGRQTPRFGSLLVASLSLLVVLGGTALIVGGRGLGIFQSTPTGSLPAPVATASGVANPSPSSTPTPEPTPRPIGSETSAPPSPDATGPLQAGDVAVMVTDGRMVIRTLPEASADSAIFKTRLYPGQRVLILEGPVEGSGYPWYRIRLGEIEGWAAGAGRDGEPWLAPVGNGLIAFVRVHADGSRDAIYTSTPDGTAGETLMLDDPDLFDYGQLTWSPDGRRLAFVATPTDSLNGTSEIFVVDADGSNLIRVSVNEVDDDSPAWAPDGTRLAIRVAQLDASAPGETNVVVTPVDRPGVTVLGPGANPVWSPDGQQVAMIVPDNGSTSLWVQAPDGTDRRRVTDLAIASARPAWSPDGQNLVVSSSGLVVVEVATGSVTPLTSRTGATPAWSTRGMIAFWATDSPSPSIFVIDSDGVGQRAVAEGVSFVAMPLWAPDGRRLLLGTDVAVSPIAVVDPADGKMTTLIQGSDTIRSPAWQPLVP